MIQAKHFFPHEDVVHRIIEDHLGNLEKRNISPILRDLQIDKDDLREAVTMLEDTVRTARRVLGGEHPLTVNIGDYLRQAHEVLREETPPAEDLAEEVD